MLLQACLGLPEKHGLAVLLQVCILAEAWEYLLVRETLNELATPGVAVVGSADGFLL